MTMPKHFFTAVALVLSMLTSTFALAQPDSPTTERNRQFIAQAFEQWADGGGSFFQDVLAPDVSWTIKGTSPAAGTYTSRDEFMQKAVAPFASRLSSPVRPTVRDIWADGDDVIVHWDGVATAKDGAPYRNSYVWIFRMKNQRAIEVIAFLDLIPYDDIIRRIPLNQTGDTQVDKTQLSYVGMWVTEDGRIRHELLPNGRYDEARGNRERAYEGRYEIKGNHINYWDDTGFTSDGVFVDENTLHHGGMIFHRR